MQVPPAMVVATIFSGIRKATMRYVHCLGVLLLLAGALAAQQKPVAHHTKPVAVAPANTEASPSLPSEETVNSFLQQMFGYDSSLSWKVAEIRPSDAAGLA